MGPGCGVESNHVMNALSSLKARPNFTLHSHGKPLGDSSLVVWSTLSTVSYPHTCRTLEDEFCFHVPTSPETPARPATNIRLALQAGSAMHQGMVSAGLRLIVDVESSQEPQTSPNEIPPDPPQSQASEPMVAPKPELTPLPSPDSFTPTLQEDSEEGG